ncbi:Histone demethylase JHD2-like protein [Drosera capensis]
MATTKSRPGRQWISDKTNGDDDHQHTTTMTRASDAFGSVFIPIPGSGKGDEEDKLWGKINIIGSEMVSLAMSLIELSRMFFHEVAEGLDEGTSCDRNEEFAASSDRKRTVDHADASIYSAATCRSCRKESAPKECLVCDSCEEVLHLSCIQPALKEIPYKNWFCSDCTRLGFRSICKRRPCACETWGATCGGEKLNHAGLEETNSGDIWRWQV